MLVFLESKEFKAKNCRCKDNVPPWIRGKKERKRYRQNLLVSYKGEDSSQSQSELVFHKPREPFIVTYMLNTKLECYRKEKYAREWSFKFLSNLWKTREREAMMSRAAGVNAKRAWQWLIKRNSPRWHLIGMLHFQIGCTIFRKFLSCIWTVWTNPKVKYQNTRWSFNCKKQLRTQACFAKCCHIC